jgi:hypothetical protein
MRLVNLFGCSAFACLVLVAGCGGSMIHGGRTVGADLPLDRQTASYTLAGCVDGEGAPIEVSDTAAAVTYHIIPGEAGPELLQRNPGEDGFLISNSWDEADGRHYFWWGLGVGMEYVVPASGPALRREYVRPGGRTEPSDGTRRPVVTGPPAATCTLTPAG